MKYSTIIFDFDGTIVDSIYLMVDIYNIIAPKFHAKPITKENREVLRNLSPKEMIDELKIPLLRIPELLLLGRQMMKQRKKELTLVAGMGKLIKELSKHYKLGILTSNNEDLVKDFLALHNLEYFDWIHSESHIFGKDTAIRKRLKIEQLKHTNVLYIGDEVRDIQSCKKAGIDIGAVTWGLNARKKLASGDPTYVFDSPKEITATLLSVPFV